MSCTRLASDCQVYDQGITMEKLSEGRGDKPAEGDYVTVHYVLKTMAGECCMQGFFDHL
jgi:FKBP-type peptidyl-prolyl cis-trans isomerase